jgi:hypothetical protein
MAAGNSYKAFCERFPGLEIHVSAWSRHKSHIVVSASAEESREYTSALSIKSLRKVNRELLAVARRAKSKGKTGDELNCYKQIVDNQSRILALEEKAAGTASSNGAAAVEELIPSDQLDEQLLEYAKQHGEFLKALLYRAGDRTVVPHIGVISTENLAKELFGNGSTQRRVKQALAQVEQMATRSDLVSGEDYFTFTDQFEDVGAFVLPEVPNQTNDSGTGTADDLAAGTSAPIGTEVDHGSPAERPRRVQDMGTWARLAGIKL